MTPNKRINLQLLVYLDALIAERHVSRAAARVDIGQPAMSAALAKLRVIFGDPLLVKTARGMVPTRRGLELAKSAQQAIVLLQSSARASFNPKADEAHFHVFAVESVALLFMPELMRFLRVEAPKVRVTVHDGDVRLAAELLREGEYDLVLGYPKSIPGDLRRLTLYPQKARVIVAADHPAIQQRISLDQYVASPHVLWGTGTTKFSTLETIVEDRLARLGRSRTVGIRVPSLLLSPAIVARTDMIATVPGRIAEWASKTLSLQTLNSPVALGSQDLDMIWHDRTHQEPAHLWLRDAIRSIARRLVKV